MKSKDYLKMAITSNITGTLCLFVAGIEIGNLNLALAIIFISGYIYSMYKAWTNIYYYQKYLITEGRTDGI